MRGALKSLAFGALGMFLALAVWHAYQDHVMLHAVVNHLAKPAAPASVEPNK